VPEVVRQKAEYIRQAGNVAVHGNKTPTPEQALDVVRELSPFSAFPFFKELRDALSSAYLLYMSGLTFTHPATDHRISVLSPSPDAAS